MNAVQPLAFALLGLSLPVIAAYFHRKRKTPLRRRAVSLSGDTQHGCLV